MAYVFADFRNYKNLDLIAAWFKLGADYLKGTKARLAFVSTNSICQGEQVALLWPYIFEQEVEIGFAYASFKWKNGARDVAGVTCVIISLRTTGSATRYIYDKGIRAEVSGINAYLAAGADTVLLARQNKSISGLADCIMGSKPTDGGNLILEPEEYSDILQHHPEATKFVKNILVQEIT